MLVHVPELFKLRILQQDHRLQTGDAVVGDGGVLGLVSAVLPEQGADQRRESAFVPKAVILGPLGKNALQSALGEIVPVILQKDLYILSGQPLLRLHGFELQYYFFGGYQFHF